MLRVIFHQLSGGQEIRVNADNVCFYRPAKDMDHRGGTQIGFVAFARINNTAGKVFVKETPEEIDQIIDAAKANQPVPPSHP